jgi:hypothetical protein
MGFIMGFIMGFSTCGLWNPFALAMSKHSLDAGANNATRWR